MKRLSLLITLIFLALQLSGCVLFHGYAPPVQQGNVIHLAKVNRLHYGMSKQAVETLMGSPVYINTFKDNVIDYIYTYQVYDNRLSDKKVIVTLRNNRVVKIKKDLRVSKKH